MVNNVPGNNEIPKPEPRLYATLSCVLKPVPCILYLPNYLSLTPSTGPLYKDCGQ